MLRIAGVCWLLCFSMLSVLSLSDDVSSMMDGEFFDLY